MGGGLFGTPFYLNPKCLVFSAAIITVYFLPKPTSNMHKGVIVFLLSVAAYISMAWYDVLYDCNDRLKPTLLGWMSKWLKPKEYSEQYDKMPIKYQKTVQMFDIMVLTMVLIAFIYPFLQKK